MADLSDVEIALVAQVVAAIGLPAGYVDGDYQIASMTGLTTRAYRGWPVSNELDVDLKEGRAHVSVFTVSGMTRITTRFPEDWKPMPRVDCTLQADVAGNTVTFSGTPAAGQLAGVRIGRPVTGLVFSYAVQASDDLPAVAASVAALIPGGTASGATVAAPLLSEARCGMAQTVYQEVQRQMQGFRISCWCPSPLTRDATAGAIKRQLAGLLDTLGRNTMFIPLADGTSGWMKPHADYVDDIPQKAHLWRRDICMQIEYPTIITAPAPVMLWGVGSVNNTPFTDAESVVADLTDGNGLPITA